MKPPAAKGKSSQRVRSRLTHRASGPTPSYLQTRIRASRLYEAAFILAIAELSRRLHQAYEHAYDKQAADWVLPQNPGQTGLNPVEGEKRWDDCMKKYLPGNYPGDRNPPSGKAVGAANQATNYDTNDSALILAIIAKETGFRPDPINDHGPMQLSGWVRNYLTKHAPDLIVPGSFDPFGRKSPANRARTFTGDYNANVQTGENWIQYQRNNLGISDYKIAYGWGPGPTADIRTAYADDASSLRNLYAPFLNCLKTGQ